MSTTSRLPQRHFDRLSGPALDQPFTVLLGWVVVHALDGRSLTLPPGATWPGLAALPAEAQLNFLVCDSTQLPSTRVTTEVHPQLLPGGVALVLAQLLRTGRHPQRHALLRALVTPVQLEANRSTLGALIGTGREYFTTVHNRSLGTGRRG